MEARNVIGKRLRYKKDAIWEVPDYQFVLPEVTKFKHIHVEEKKVDMDEFLVFLGIWYSEGCTSGDESSGRVMIAVNKQRVKDVLYPVLDELEYKYSISNQDCLMIYDKQLYSYMKPLSVGSINKNSQNGFGNLVEINVKYY